MEMNIDDLSYNKLNFDLINENKSIKKICDDDSKKFSIDENHCSLNVEIDDPDYLKTDPLESNDDFDYEIKNEEELKKILEESK